MVNSTPSIYNEWKPIWKRCRDFTAGQDAVRKGGETYLPRLDGQKDEAYQKYLKSAYLYNASGRTRQGLTGMVMRKEPEYNIPASMGWLIDDVDQEGTNLKEFAKILVKEELTVARGGILVDYPNEDTRGMSEADAERLNLRPYMVHYKAEDILDYRTERVHNSVQVVQVRLMERDEEPGENEFETETVERVRVLDLVTDEGAEPYYRQRLFVSEDKGEFIEDIEQRYVPTINGQTIDEIPFVFVGGHRFREPHLLDLVNANTEHYVHTADYNAGLKWTTRPQPYVTGENEESLVNTDQIGTGALWIIPSTEARVGMLEYAGTGLSAMEKKLEQLKDDMATLGARMIAADKRAAETAEVHVIKRQGENSALSTVAGYVSEALTGAVEWCARWVGASDEVEVSLNTDFLPTQLSADDAVKWTTVLQSGAILPDDYYHVLQMGEVLDPTITKEDRLNRLETSR